MGSPEDTVGWRLCLALGALLGVLLGAFMLALALLLFAEGWVKQNLDAIGGLTSLLGGVAAVAVPLAVVLVAQIIGKIVKEREVAVEFVKISLSILQSEDKRAETLRSWAVDVFADQSPVPVSEELQEELRKGTSKMPRPDYDEKLAAAFGTVQAATEENLENALAKAINRSDLPLWEKSGSVAVDRAHLLAYPIVPETSERMMVRPNTPLTISVSSPIKWAKVVSGGDAYVEQIAEDLLQRLRHRLVEKGILSAQPAGGDGT